MLFLRQFFKLLLNFSKEKKVLCRIIRFFHVYGGKEKKIRLWPSLIKNAKQNKDFIMSLVQKTDFNYIKDVIDGLI